MSVILIVILVLLVIAIAFLYKIYKKVSISQSCSGISSFSGGKYSKSLTIPIINYSIELDGIFNDDGTLDLEISVDGSSKYSYKDNTWVYDKDNCKVIISLDKDLQNTVANYASIDLDLILNKDSSLTINAVIANVLPITQTLYKSS